MESVVFFSVIGIAALGLLARTIYRYLRSFLAARNPPVRIHLRLRNDETQSSPRQVQNLQRKLKTEGFTSIGVYEIPELPYLYLSVHIDRQGVLAIIYEHLLIGVGVDLFVRQGDKGGLTVSNVKTAQGLTPPPWSQRYILPDAPVDEVIERFRTEADKIPAASWHPMTSANFSSYFESSYADEIDWRNGLGGPTLKEINSFARDGEENSEVVLTTWKNLRKAAHRAFHTGTALRFRDSSPRHSNLCENDLLLLYDSLTLERLGEVMGQHLYGGAKKIVIPRICEPMEARAVFARVQELLPSDGQYKELGEIEFPHRVQIFLRPEHGIPAELFQVTTSA